MSRKHTHEELNKCSREELVTMVLAMQDQVDTLNGNIERLIEQVRIANSYRFGHHTEKMEAIYGQLSFFNEADAMYDDTAAEPTAEEVLPPRPRRRKTKGQRETDLKDFPRGNPSTLFHFRKRTGCVLWQRQLEADAGRDLQKAPS